MTEDSDAMSRPLESLDRLLQCYEDVLSTLKQVDLEHVRLDHSSCWQELMAQYKKIKNCAEALSNQLTSEPPSIKTSTLWMNATHNTSPDSPRDTWQSGLQKFCGQYNKCTEDLAEKMQFLQTYNPMRIAVVNATSRRRDASLGPDFQTRSDGIYYAVNTIDERIFLVVPRFDLVLQDSIYAPSAFSEVFECPKFNSERRYRHVKVIQPAFFEPDSAQQRWTLKEKGELDLGPNE